MKLDEQAPLEDGHHFHFWQAVGIGKETQVHDFARFPRKKIEF